MNLRHPKAIPFARPNLGTRLAAAAPAFCILALSLVFLVTTAWGAPPPNDKFSNSRTLNGNNLTITDTNVDATKQPGEPNHAGNPGGKSIWYSWTAPGAGEVTITTDDSAIDTLLAVYTGSSVSALTLVAANDDHGIQVTSRVRFNVRSGVTYVIAVDGFFDGTEAEAGIIQFAVQFTPGPIPRPLNDNFADATILTGAPLSISTWNTNASRELDEPYHAGGVGDTSIWWRWTAPDSGTYQVTTAGSEFDTLLAVYTGTNVAFLNEIATSDDDRPDLQILTSTLRFNALAGQEYCIAVDGYDSGAGVVKLGIVAASIELSNPQFIAGTGFRMDIKSLPGQVFLAQATTNFLNWTILGTRTNITGTMTFTDPAATNSPRRLYRLQAVQ